MTLKGGKVDDAKVRGIQSAEEHMSMSFAPNFGRLRWLLCFSIIPPPVAALGICYEYTGNGNWSVASGGSAIHHYLQRSRCRWKVDSFATRGWELGDTEACFHRSVGTRFSQAGP